MKKISILSIIILAVQISFGQTTILDNTNVSGSWTLANSPYIIEGRAIIPNGQTLTIDPGVEVRLRSSASPTVSWFDYGAGNVGVIRVRGELIANGTSTDQILFTRDNTGFWGTILIDENASSSSSFTNCIFEYSKESCNVTGITSVVTFDAGISIYRNTITFDNNVLRENQRAGMLVREASTLFEFSNNEFYDNGANGLVISESTANSINNTFYNNSFSTTGSVSAVRCSSSDVYLVGNLIYNNDDFGVFTTNNGNINIVNNTIFGNFQGVRVEGGANTSIANTIIQNNDLNFAVSSPGGATIEMEYSLTDENSLPSEITDLGNNVLNEDALFTNSGGDDYSLLSNSPCIDNGNPFTTGLNIPNTDVLGNNRIDNTIVDIGATEFQQPVINYTVTTASNPMIGGTTSGGGTFADGSNVSVSAVPNTNYNFVNWTENGAVVSNSANYSFEITSDINLVANFEFTLSVNENEVDENSIVIYPNPINDYLTIKSSSFLSVEVFDVYGKLVLSTNESKIDLSSQPSGIYILKVKSLNSVVTMKRVIKK